MSHSLILLLADEASAGLTVGSINILGRDQAFSISNLDAYDAYSNIENGKKLPTGGDLQRIADVLGVKIQYIVTPVPKIHSLRFRF